MECHLVMSLFTSHGHNPASRVGYGVPDSPESSHGGKLTRPELRVKSSVWCPRTPSPELRARVKSSVWCPRTPSPELRARVKSSVWCPRNSTRHGDAGRLVRAESLLDPLVGHPVLFPEAAERGDELFDRPLRHGLIPALEGSHLLGEAEEALHGLTLGRGPPPGIQGLQVLADGLQGLDDPTDLLAVAGDPVDDALLLVGVVGLHFIDVDEADLA